jgi:hypothetical protein
MHTRCTTISLATLLAPAALLARSGTALAQPTDATPAVVDDAHVAPPHAGSWTLGFRYPWDLQSLPDGIAYGTGGIGIAVGARITDRVYVGVSADVVAITREFDRAGGPKSYDRFRAGVEARWYFHDGLAFASPGEEPWSAPRYDWLGVRWGEEARDDSAVTGRFAELSLGTDISYGTIGMGVALSAGVSREPVALSGAATPIFEAIGAAPSAAHAPAQANSPYVGFALSLLFQ